MQEELPNGLEEKFLQSCIKTKCKVDVYLVNGIKLTGKILGKGDNCIAITASNNWNAQLVYKHNICSILPEDKAP